MRLVVFGDDEAAAGVLVEPVDDAGPRHAADAAQLPGAMMQQRVDERVFLVAGGGMDDEAGGLVQHEQRFVLEQNVERDFLRLRLGGPGVRPVDFNLFAGAGRVRGLDGLAVDADVALFDEPLQRAARDGGKLFAQKNVEPPAGQGLFDGENFRALAHNEFRRFLWRVLVFPGDEENQADAGADGGVGDVEGGKADFAAAALCR